MLKRTLLITILFIFLADCEAGQKPSNSEVTMPSEQLQKLLVIVENQESELPRRVAALKEMGASGNSSTIRSLKQLLLRARPDPRKPGMINWDPAGAERVVDLYVVAALSQLGDTSEINRIAQLVASGGRILKGPDDEIRNAVLVILSVGRVEPVEQIVSLCERQNLLVVRNAVRTLNQLILPQAAAAGQVDAIPGLSATVTFEISRFREEIEAIEKLSQGRIVLSENTKKFLKTNDYDRGTVKREGVRLAEVVEQDLDMLDLCYYVEAERVVICTYTEAGQRWRKWWGSYGKNLAYDKKAGRFVLRR